MVIASVRVDHDGGFKPGEATRPKIDVPDHLLCSRAGVYDRKVAEILTFASAWAYSRIETFAQKMALRGLPRCECVSLTLSNDALLLDVSAQLVQSDDGRLAILCFRGTEPRNAINWLMDATGFMEPFDCAGYVHGGFHRAVRALWPELKEMLKIADSGDSICEGAEVLKRSKLVSCVPREDDGPKPLSGASIPGVPRKPLEALYIAGHSLAGAMAVLAAASIHADLDLQPLMRKLRGVYTYGQPRVGDELFAHEQEGVLGHKLFRHVYERDVVPRFPPRAMGRFAHFGRQYNSSDAGWVLQSKPVRQALTLGLSNFIGVTAWLLRDVIPLSNLHLPFSWGDHSPIHYMRTSIAMPPGSELG